MTGTGGVMMNYRKVIDRLNDYIRWGISPVRVTDAKTAVSAIQELQKYKQLGTLEEVREAVEKQRTKKPTYDGDGYAPDGTFVWDEWICPKCGNRYEVDYNDYDYCPKCGQHIDWSEEE